MSEQSYCCCTRDATAPPAPCTFRIRCVETFRNDQKRSETTAVATVCTLGCFFSQKQHKRVFHKRWAPMHPISAGETSSAGFKSIQSFLNALLVHMIPSMDETRQAKQQQQQDTRGSDRGASQSIRHSVPSRLFLRCSEETPPALTRVMRMSKQSATDAMAVPF